MTRMGKITVLNTFNLQMKDNKDKIVTIENYSSINTEYDDLGTKWVIDFVKEKETEALLKFSGGILGVTSDNGNSGSVSTTGSTTGNNTNKDTGKDINLIQSIKRKTHGSLSLTILICSTTNELIRFLIDPNFYARWMGPSIKQDGDTVTFENISLKGIPLYNEEFFNNSIDNSIDKSVSFQYKWKEWEEYSSVKIGFMEIGDNVKVTVEQSHVPVEVIENVRNHWKTRIFGVISSVYGCSIKEY